MSLELFGYLQLFGGDCEKLLSDDVAFISHGTAATRVARKQLL